MDRSREFLSRLVRRGGVYFRGILFFFRVLVHGFISTQGSSYVSQAVWLIFIKINHNGKISCKFINMLNGS